MARGSVILLGWLLLVVTLSATLGLGMPVSTDRKRRLRVSDLRICLKQRMVHCPCGRSARGGGGGMSLKLLKVGRVPGEGLRTTWTQVQSGSIHGQV